MKEWLMKKGGMFVLILAGLLIAGPVLAEKPPWAGGKDKGAKSKSAQDKPDKDKAKSEVHTYFTEKQRVVVHDYYAGQWKKKGKCPPGLAKKNNGCLPPGQAKKWAVGQPLPAGVVTYALPSSLLVKLGPPPPNHKFIRVAQDILLLATGTGMVVDAIENLSWEFSR